MNTGIMPCFFSVPLTVCYVGVPYCRCSLYVLGQEFGFVMCGCFGNMVICVLCFCIVCTVFLVLFYLCITILICY